MNEPIILRAKNKKGRILVYCKDCKYWREESKDRFYCERLFYWTTMDADDFCSRGEKR